MSKRKTFDITIVSHAKHGILWELVKRFGGIAALAREIGIGPGTMSYWVRLKKMPRIVGKGSTRKTRKALLKLVELAERPIEDIFPGFVREKLNEIPSSVEHTQQVGAAQLEYGERLEERFVLPSPERAFEAKELREQLRKIIKTLSYREREVIRLRYGIDGAEHTLQEVGDILGVGRERIRQVEGKAIRRLRQSKRGSKLSGYLGDERETDD